jgi:hypothetical protein
VRSERAFCEELTYHLLFRWFLDMDLLEPSFDHSTFSKNRARLLRHRVSREFFDAVVLQADRLHLLSDEHFSVDGTLIEAAASPKMNHHRPSARTVAAQVIAGSTSTTRSGRMRPTTAQLIAMLGCIAKDLGRKLASVTWDRHSWKIVMASWWTSRSLRPRVPLNETWSLS